MARRRKAVVSDDEESNMIDMPVQEEPMEVDDDEPGPSEKRKKKAAAPAKASKRQKVVEQVEDEEPEEEMDEAGKAAVYEEYRKVEFVSRATLVSLNHKGTIKEADLKPFLSQRGRGDWQEGLKTVQDNLENVFGLSLIHCGPDHLFTLRNNLLDEIASVSELFAGKLDGERIDDNGYTFRTVIDEDAMEEEAFLFPILTMIMMSGGEKSNDWTTTGDILSDFVVDKLEMTPEMYSKLLGGKNPLYVKQQWIRRTIKQIDGTEPVQHFYWGPRAKATVSGSKLLEKYCLATGTQKACFGNFYKQLQNEDYKEGKLKQGPIPI